MWEHFINFKFPLPWPKLVSIEGRKNFKFLYLNKDGSGIIKIKLTFVVEE